MVVEQNLLNDKWVQTNDGYVKLGVILIKRCDEWECHYAEVLEIFGQWV